MCSEGIIKETDSLPCFDIDSSQRLSQINWRSGYFEKVGAVVEYEWPLGSGQDYFIEEYLADYLEIKSLRRFYPLVERRRIQMLDEREYLLKKGFVNELQCDLGVMVIPADQVYEHIALDHVQKFQVYRDALWLMNYAKTVTTSLNADADSSNCEVSHKFKLPMTADELKMAALKSCVSWNSGIKKSSRGAIFIHDIDKRNPSERQRKTCSRHSENPKINYFPLANKPGQFVNYPRRFSSEFLLHVPVDTILKGPYTLASKYNLLMKGNNLDGLPYPVESNCCSPSECSTINFDTDSVSSSSSTLTCSVSEFESDFSSSSDSFLF